MLTHYNVGANVEQLEQVFGLDDHDRMLGVLPFFHSFGFTGTLPMNNAAKFAKAPATLGGSKMPTMDCPAQSGFRR